MTCPFGLRRKCPFGFNSKKLLEDRELVRVYCAMCVKSLYAKAKLKCAKRYVVVNTL